MAGILNMKAYLQLFDEDIAWLFKQPRTLERDHIKDCLQWMRDNKHKVESVMYDGKITMTKYPITLSPDEDSRVLALESGEPMVLTRPFDPQPPDDANQIGFDNNEPPVLWFWSGDSGVHDWETWEAIVPAKHPFGKPGDVLRAEGECLDGRGRVFAKGTIAKLTVVSVTPRQDGETWVVDAEVRKERL